MNDDSIYFGRHVSVVPISEDGLIGDPFDPTDGYTDFITNGGVFELPDGTSVTLRYANTSSALIPANSGLLMQHADADGMPLGEESDLSDLLGPGSSIGARLDESGNIAILQASRDNVLTEITFSPDGSLVSREQLYSQQDTSEILEFSEPQLEQVSPDGGGARLNLTPEDDGYDISVLSLDDDGMQDGVPLSFGSREAAIRYETALGDDGTVWMRFADRTIEDGRSVYSWENGAFRIITPRDLSDEDDFEFLSAPEAVDGGAGDDVIMGSDGLDRLLGGEGADVLVGGAGDDLMHGGAGNDVLMGGEGDADTAFYRANWADYSVSADGDRLWITGTGDAAIDGEDRLTGVERLVFTDLAVSVEDFLAHYGDSFAGTEGDDLFTGNAGANRLEGLGGNDTLNGGDGPDTLLGGDGGDLLTGGESSSDLRDEIHGGAGNDMLIAGYGNDFAVGDDGNDTIEGGFGADTLAGGSGADVVTGGALSDMLLGGEGDDFLNGGYGFDRLNGGAGADRFFHLGTSPHGTDWLQDYDSSEDDVLIWGGGAVSADDFLVQFAETPGAGQAGVEEAFVTHVPSGLVVWALVDGADLDSITVLSAGESFDIM
ncbi:calcium-binding protein [Salipiger abyssi]|nr:calcium-binding protein [Salipiger abyssi]